MCINYCCDKQLYLTINNIIKIKTIDTESSQTADKNLFMYKFSK